ncbi:MAG: YcxB family protein [Ruminococcus flavefaciens]|nr:YcxB family protein [Ruminococcus flavefaciens]
MTENNYRLEKEYTIPFEIFREGYTAFQKKFVFPQANVTALAFIILAGVFVFAVIDDNSQYFSYLLIMVCLAMAVRQWYNPRKMRANLFESFRSMGETVYKISVGDSYADISTVSTVENVETVENSAGDSEDDDDDYSEEPLPEKSRIPFDENFSMLEYERFFLMFSGKSIFYIIPKENFSGEEIQILRNLKSA